MKLAIQILSIIALLIIITLMLWAGYLLYEANKTTDAMINYFNQYDL